MDAEILNGTWVDENDQRIILIIKNKKIISLINNGLEMIENDSLIRELERAPTDIIVFSDLDNLFDLRFINNKKIEVFKNKREMLEFNQLDLIGNFVKI
ncbi:MAG: hypothetical protein WCI53_08080 [Bacteroidota bacterium]|jgi:hypothetical protein